MLLSRVRIFFSWFSICCFSVCRFLSTFSIAVIQRSISLWSVVTMPSKVPVLSSKDWTLVWSTGELELSPEPMVAWRLSRVWISSVCCCTFCLISVMCEIHWPKAFCTTESADVISPCNVLILSTRAFMWIPGLLSKCSIYLSLLIYKTMRPNFLYKAQTWMEICMKGVMTRSIYKIYLWYFIGIFLS